MPKKASITEIAFRSTTTTIAATPCATMTSPTDASSGPLAVKAITEPSIMRHPEFYFSDGSVVIIVERTAFRVHQSVLARHSEVFNGMWDVPQPNRAEMYDNCPMVVLSDSVYDFTDVMRVIYDAFHFDKLKPDTNLSSLIKFIAGILRISTKYGMHQLRNKCIAIIQEKFPSTLQGCDDVLSRGIQYVPSEIVRIIPLARETTVPKVLPWAFYLCAQISVDDILANTVLSWRDKALCLAGKERLWEAQKTMTHGFLVDFKQSQQCASSCQTRGARQLALEYIENLRRSPHPLQEYTDWKSLGLCAKCHAHSVMYHREGRDRVWQQLPSMFHLGTWDEIFKDQSC